MNINFDELKSQLYPGWTPVNIAVVFVGVLISWPLALMMIAYIYWGGQVGLDLRAPSSYKPGISNAFHSLQRFISEIIGKFQNPESTASAGNPDSHRTPNVNEPEMSTTDQAYPGGKPTVAAGLHERTTFEQWRDDELRVIKQLRTQLDNERAIFEKDKKRHLQETQKS